MTYKKAGLLALLLLSISLVFSPGGLAAPDMPLLLVGLQHLPHLGVKPFVALGQPLLQILVYCGFGNAEMLGRAPNGGAVFDYVHSQLADPFFDSV